MVASPVVVQSCKAWVRSMTFAKCSRQWRCTLQACALAVF
jgi:hypothetical protein